MESVMLKVRRQTEEEELYETEETRRRRRQQRKRKRRITDFAWDAAEGGEERKVGGC